MKAKRFSQAQIIAVLKEAEASAKTKDLCRRHGISDAPKPITARTTKNECFGHSPVE